MSEVVTGPVPLPDEGQDITEISQRMSIRTFVDYFWDNLPQPFRVDTASNQRYGELREDNLLVACMVKTVLVIKAKKQDSGKTVIIPINSAITFALLPKGTDEVRLGASWEGTFTVAEMMKLTVLPPAAKVLLDCKDHDKKKVSKGTILYNLTTFTTKVLKKRGVKGVSSFGVVHNFVEGEDVQFSTRQLDTKCNLAEIYDLIKAPLRARVFCDGGTQLNHNDVVVFKEKEERTFLVGKTVNNQEPSSSMFSIPTDFTGAQVTAVRIKGYTSELLVKQKTLLRRQSSSKVVQDEGNQYVDSPIRMDVRDEPNPSDFEEPEYESVRRLSSETALSVSMESLVSDTYMEMKVSYYNVSLSHPSNTTDYPNRTRRRSEDIREALYYSRPRFSVTATTGTVERFHSTRRYSVDNACVSNIPPSRIDESEEMMEHSSPQSSHLRGLGTGTSRTRQKVIPLQLPTLQEETPPGNKEALYVNVNLEVRTPDRNSPLKESPSKLTPKPHSPRTVTQEQRYPSPATPRQGKGPPVMPQVSLDELKSSKVLNKRTTCTSSPGGPCSSCRESEDDISENLEAVTKPPPKPPVKPKPKKEPPSDPRFKVTPTNLQLLHHVARHIRYNWRLFCTFLEMEESSLDEADHKGMSLQEKCYKALLLWLQGEGKEPKWWTTILQALRKSDLTRVALDIQHHIMSGTLSLDK